MSANSSEKSLSGFFISWQEQFIFSKTCTLSETLTEIFETTDYSFDILSQRLRELAFLNRGLKITIDDERTQKKHEFFYKGGLLSFVEHLNRAKAAIHPKVVHFEGEKDGVGCEIAMQWNDGYIESVFSFANNINTIEGGTHLVGFRSALTR